jgi:hypothetical protein
MGVHRLKRGLPNFGPSGMGGVLLFDPEGRLVQGDEAVLVDTLKSPGRPSRAVRP